MAVIPMSLFGTALGLAHPEPIGGFVTGAGKALFFDKSLQQVQGIAIGIEPVAADSPGVHGQKL